MSQSSPESRGAAENKEVAICRCYNDAALGLKILLDAALDGSAAAATLLRSLSERLIVVGGRYACTFDREVRNDG